MRTSCAGGMWDGAQRRGLEAMPFGRAAAVKNSSFSLRAVDFMSNLH